MVDTFPGAFANIFGFLGDVAFTWVPATVGAVTGTAPGASPPISLISGPVTLAQASAFLGNSPASTPFFHFWVWLVICSTIVTIAFFGLMALCLFRLGEIRRHEHQNIEAAAHPVAAGDVSRTQLRWNGIIEEANSNDERQWRVAILEADIMLNELLDVLGYRGETMADKMKQVDRAAFHTIDQAWEAHRVRNQVAHEGAAHLLNSREVRRVIGSYEEVFREFNVIE